MSSSPAWSSLRRLLSPPGFLLSTPPPPPPPSRRILTAHTRRSFSSTPPVHTKTFQLCKIPEEFVPPYPYGERRLFKQSNRALYASSRIQFGNIVSPKHGTKAPRTWYPNIVDKSLYSDALRARVRTRLTFRVLKTIRHEGGIDNYILKSKPTRIKDLGPGGWRLRWLLMQTQAFQERANKERIALGLKPKPVQNRDAVINYVLDRATPGPLSRTSLAFHKTINYKSPVIVLGNESLAKAPNVEELSDEKEATLMRQSDAPEPINNKSRKRNTKQPPIVLVYRKRS